MKEIEGIAVEFTLTRTPPTHEAEVAIWVDENDDDIVVDTEKVDLEKEGLTWSGEYEFESPRSAKGLLFRVSFFADLGDTWTFKVKSSAGDELVDVNGKVTSHITKFWYRVGGES